MKEVIQEMKNGLILEGYDANDPFIKGAMTMLSMLEKRLIPDRRLVTVKRANEITGASISFFKKLLREERLTRFKIGNATYVSITEFEELANRSHEKTSKYLGRKKVLTEEQVVIKDEL